MSEVESGETFQESQPRGFWPTLGHWALRIIVAVFSFASRIFNSIHSHLSRDYACFKHTPNLADNVALSRTFSFLIGLACIPAWALMAGLSFFLPLKNSFPPLLFSFSLGVVVIATLLSTLLFFTCQPVTVLLASILTGSISGLLFASFLLVMTTVLKEKFAISLLFTLYACLTVPFSLVFLWFFSILFLQWHTSETVRRRVGYQRAVTRLSGYHSDGFSLNIHPPVSNPPSAYQDNIGFRVRRWLEDEDGETTYWITHSDPAERTAFSQFIANVCIPHQQLVASVFLGDASSSTPEPIDALANILSQVADNYAAARESILHAAESGLIPGRGWFFPFWILDQSSTLPWKKTLSIPRNAERIGSYLIEPFKDAQNAAPFVILVDSLNTDNSRDVMALVNALREARLSVRILISSDLEVFRKFNGDESEVFKPLASLHIGGQLLDSYENPQTNDCAYEATLRMLLCRIHKTAGDEGNRLWQTLHSYFQNVNHSDPVVTLLRSQQTRVLLTEMLSSIQMLHHPRVKEALDDDDLHVADLLRVVLDSPTHCKQVLALRDKDARVALNVIQMVLDGPMRDTMAAESGSLRVQAQHLLVKLSKASGILPSALVVQDVTLTHNIPVSSGGFADIYRGMHRGQFVAIKRIRLFSNQTDEEQQRKKQVFYREALLWRQLKSSHIVPFIGIDTETFALMPCLVSAWMINGTIADHMKRNGPLNSFTLERHLFEVAQGLEYLHSQKIVHGDLHGGNILVDDQWRACLSDFGLAGLVGGPQTSTQTSNRDGARRWMAPELWSPEQYGITFKRTPASDVYAFGCVSCEIYSGGEVPFADILPHAVMMRVLGGGRPSRPVDSVYLRPISDTLWDLIQRCWCERPEDRLEMHQVVDEMVSFGFVPTTARPGVGGVEAP